MSTIENQRAFWNKWNSANRETQIGEISARQAEVITAWLSEERSRDLDILEVGCGTGWFCPVLAKFGNVTGTDLSDEVLKRAQLRWPNIRFIAGDFEILSFDPESFEVVVSLEVLSHVSDQEAFVARIARLLRPGGVLLLATQNRTVLSDYCAIPPPAPGQIRNWVDRQQLLALLRPHLVAERLISVTPIAHKGLRRILVGRRLAALLRPIIGERWRDVMERHDWGWTLILKARKPTK